jgi:hypothetical protein
VVNATSGAMVQQVAAGADGSFSVSRLPAGVYYLYAGQDEDGDRRIGVPGRRFGWYGAPGGPTPITIASGGNASASLNIGTPVETKPHTTLASANRLTVNSYIVGQITATDQPAMYVIQFPATGTYFIEAAGVLGSCGFGIELNTVLELLDSTGATIAGSDDAGLPGATFCSAMSGQATAGTYYMRVSGAPFSPSAPSARTGQYRIWVRDQP